MPRGRPKKVATVEETEKTEEVMTIVDNNEVTLTNSGVNVYAPTLSRDIHHIVRGLSKIGNNPEYRGAGYFSAAENDSYIAGWLEQGYDLRFFNVLKEDDYGYQLLYVLVR